MLFHLHDDRFCRGVALVLRGESQKASTYVTHNPSLGVLREKMVGSFIRHETPERFRVETGLIHNHDLSLTSKQIDLLVHEPWNIAPLYRYEDFVIVHAAAARAVIEVKSQFYNDDFSLLLGVNDSVRAVAGPRQYSPPVFGYGLEGATLETLTGYLRNALNRNHSESSDDGEQSPAYLNWPDCIAIQNRNIVGFRPFCCGGDKKDWPICFCLLDLTKASNRNGPCRSGWRR